MSLEFINGAPGCGKTFNLVKRFAESPVRAKVYLAFTDSAKEEALERIIEKEPEASDKPSKLLDNSEPVVSTIHSMGLLLYSRYVEKIQRDVEANVEIIIDNIKRKICKKLNIAITDNPDSPGNRMFLEFERQRNLLFDSIDFSLIANKSGIAETRAREAIEQYLSEIKKTPWKTDFTGILEALRENKIKLSDFADEIYIDEFQDLTKLQLSLFDFSGKKKIVVAGDIDQTVYQFLGVDTKAIYDLYQDSKKIHLPNVRRVPRNLFKVAKAVRRMMRWKADYDPESINTFTGKFFIYPTFETGIDYLMKLPGSKMILVYRNKDLREGFAYLVSRYGVIPKIYSRRKFKKMQRVAELVANLQEQIKLSEKTGDWQAVSLSIFDALRVEVPPNKSSILNFLKNELSELTQKFFGRKFFDLPKLKFANDIWIDTVHEAKGREADNVLLFDYYPRMKYETNIFEIDAQAKMLYVALTRTRKNILVARLSSSRGRIYNSLLRKFTGL